MANSMIAVLAWSAREKEKKNVRTLKGPPAKEKTAQCQMLGGDERYYDQWCRYLFHIDNESFTLLGRDLTQPIRRSAGTGSENSAVLRNKIYFGSAGWADGRGAFDAFEMAPENNEVIFSLRKARESFQECYASDRDDFIFILGGRTISTGDKDLNIFQTYQLSTNTWTGYSIPIVRYYLFLSLSRFGEGSGFCFFCASRGRHTKQKRRETLTLY